MLARYENKDVVDVFKDTDSNFKICEFFLKTEKKYVVVIDEKRNPIGIIYRNDLSIIKEDAKISDLIKKRLVMVEKGKSINEIDNLLFSLAKEQIDVVVQVDKSGKFDGIWEKIVNTDEKFYEKYIFVKQAGYSIADWITYYYGKDATIGIHSWSEYTEYLINDLENTGIKIKFVCQGNGNIRGVWGEKVEKSFADITKDDLSACDLVINTFMSLQNQVQYLYSKHKNYKNIISIYDIINELYSYERDAGYMLRVANIIASTGRKVVIFDYPTLLEQKNHSQREELLLKRKINVKKIQKMVADKDDEIQDIVMPALNKARKRCAMDKVTYESFAELYPQMSEKSLAHMKYIGNTCKVFDMDSKYMNIKNGMRVTLVANAESTTKMHIFGKSWIFGYHCTDELTIPSYIQRISNDENLKLEVVNHAMPGLREDVLANHMLEWDSQCPKDEMFVLVHMFNDYGNSYNKNVAQECGYVNTLSVDRPHNYGEIWVDTGHIGEDGSEFLARQILSKIMGSGMVVPGVFRNKFNSSAGRKIYKYENQDQVSLWADMPEFKEYQKYIAEYKQRIGGIVMNCNPFTLGHRYLIETASKQCDKLYIFVVEEDKSIFPFEDRLELVRKGTSDLGNVTVLQSGNFIISALTFPGYFTKSVNNNVSVDTSDDLSLFAKHIAPTLGINVRFAGEEPIDIITRQYNETMREVFPKHGIEFVEIPRKEMGDSVISASRVRKLLKEEQFDEISKIVPNTTLEYLKSNLDNLKERLAKENK